MDSMGLIFFFSFHAIVAGRARCDQLRGKSVFQNLLINIEKEEDDRNR